MIVESLYQLCKYKILSIYKNGMDLINLHLPESVKEDLIEDHECYVLCKKFNHVGYFVNVEEKRKHFTVSYDIVTCSVCFQNYQLKGEFFIKSSYTSMICSICHYSISRYLCDCFTQLYCNVRDNFPQVNE